MGREYRVTTELMFLQNYSSAHPVLLTLDEP